MKLTHPFVQLPVTFDAARLMDEIDALGEAPWRPHPQKFVGNSMLPLAAVDGDPGNENYKGPMRPTPELQRCPYLMRAIGALGVVVGRTRLMRLAGRAEVERHVDQGYYWADRVRVHVPIITQPSVRFQCGDAEVNMAAGECWIFDTWRMHRVINDGDDRRIHLVVDTVGGDAFWRLFAGGRPHPTPKPMPDWKPRLVGEEGPAQPITFERTNVPDVMNPWELEGHLTFMLREAGAQPALMSVVLWATRFVSAWRALWARYGDAPDGWPVFRACLQAFLDDLHDDPGGRVLMANEVALAAAITTRLKLAVVSEGASLTAAPVGDRG